LFSFYFYHCIKATHLQHFMATQTAYTGRRAPHRSLFLSFHPSR